VAASVTIKGSVELERDGWIDVKPLRFFATIGDDGGISASVHGYAPDRRSVSYGDRLNRETLAGLIDAIVQMIDGNPDDGPGATSAGAHRLDPQAPPAESFAAAD
jgi:hypothetical protein